ncbi:MAG: 6-pyruvoyl-tetrahydropterin synthase-related protein, partial [Anaerolineae bacterium]
MEIKKQTPLPIDPGLPVAILLALFAALPLLTHAGLPNTADGPAHLMRQVELNRAWQDGILYPRWAPDLALGHGMPLFNYAPPLLYFVTQLLHLTGLPLDASMKGSVIAAMMLYPAGMYLFARELFGGRGGLLAAAVYLYAPYRLREAYIQGNYGQFWGLAFYPLILWAFHRLVTTGRRRHIPAAALALAGLLLSHNISAMLFAPLFGLYLLLLIVKKGPSGRPGLAAVGAAIALGLGLSAFFWLPAFGEQGLIRLAGITRGFFDFRRNFITLPELLALPRPLDLSAINPYFPLGLGPAQIWLAAGGAALLLTARRRASGGALGRRWPEFS